MTDVKVLAKVVLQHSDGTVLLLRRSANDERRPNAWDFPGGNVEPGEDFMAAAVRETAEEAGIAVDPASLRLAFTRTELEQPWGNLNWLIFVGKTDIKDVVLSIEHSEYAWVTLDEAIDMITYERQNAALLHIRNAQLLDVKI